MCETTSPCPRGVSSLFVHMDHQIADELAWSSLTIAWLCTMYNSPNMEAEAVVPTW